VVLFVVLFSGVSSGCGFRVVGVFWFVLLVVIVLPAFVCGVLDVVGVCWWWFLLLLACSVSVSILGWTIVFGVELFEFRLGFVV